MAGRVAGRGSTTCLGHLSNSGDRPLADSLESGSHLKLAYPMVLLSSVIGDPRVGQSSERRCEALLKKVGHVCSILGEVSFSSNGSGNGFLFLNERVHTWFDEISLDE